MTKILFCLSILSLAAIAHADDWPTYRADAQRSAYTREKLPEKLTLQWSYQAKHAPRPAWPSSIRLSFDRAHHSVIAGGQLYFGSSVDGKVYALDAKSGAPLWDFFTDGPIRFAPVVWKDRVLVVSDDGHLYALSAADGKLLWKKRGGPQHRLILGNARMASRWPARGGPVVEGNTVYFASGIWPSDGLFLYAIDAETGDTQWVNKDSGSMEMDQPHGGARAKSGASAQGYLVTSDQQLFVPTGRAVPATFGLSDGKFNYFHLRKNSKNGGSSIMATDSLFFNSGMLFDSQSGLSTATLGKGPAASWPGGMIHASEQGLTSYRWIDQKKKNRKGKNIDFRGIEKIWFKPDIKNAISLIIAGENIICGEPGRIQLINRTSQKVTWSGKVDGLPLALAVAGQRLYVGTDRGTLYCFSGEKTPAPALAQPQHNSSPYGDNTRYAKAAQEIIDKTGISEGYCLDFACGDGALAYELAKRTQLQIYAVDDDPQKVAEARRKLDAAGFYGSRVTVILSDLGKTPYPDSFADLVVSARSLDSNLGKQYKPERQRLQRPFGGIACLGNLDAMEVKQRGALEGVGSWTHQYANAANTSCSSDNKLKGPLEMLWYKDVDFEMADRHTRAPAPLFHQGKLVVIGLNALRAVDAYNGRVLWEYPLPGILLDHNEEEHNLGVSGTSGVFCLSDDSVFVRRKHSCLRINLHNGKLLQEYKIPAELNQSENKPARWAYLAYEKGTLYGSVANQQHLVQNPRWQWVGEIPWNTDSMLTESSSLFAIDVKSSKTKWSYNAKDSIRNNAIAIGAQGVFLIDRPLAEMDKKERRRQKPNENPHPQGRLVALDTEKGEVLWQQDQNIYGTMLALSAEHDALLMAYQSTTDRLPSEKGGHMTVFKASKGERLWDRPAGYITRPLINGNTIYAQGGAFQSQSFKGGKTGWVSQPGGNGAWDLLTGEERNHSLGRSYGCGQIAASTHLLVYRSATLGYYDLQRKAGTENYGGLRLGCWINAIPAGGLVLVPDATTGCSCSYLNRAWFALQPKQ